MTRWLRHKKTKRLHAIDKSPAYTDEFRFITRCGHVFDSRDVEVMTGQPMKAGRCGTCLRGL